MQSSEVMVISDPQTIEYIFNTDNAVSMTEFKAAQGLADIGLLLPVKALHNGCDKLIYKITGLNSLSDVVRSNGGNISDMTGKLGRIIDEVKEFGFLQVQHLDWDMDRIFVEPGEKKIYMIYLPAEVTQPEPWENRYWHIIDEIKAKAPSMLAEETAPAFTAQENAQPQKTEENKKGIFKKIFKEKKPEQGTKNAAYTKGGKKGKKAAAASYAVQICTVGTLMIYNIARPVYADDTAMLVADRLAVRDDKVAVLRIFPDHILLFADDVLYLLRSIDTHYHKRWWLANCDFVIRSV